MMDCCWLLSVWHAFVCLRPSVLPIILLYFYVYIFSVKLLYFLFWNSNIPIFWTLPCTWHPGKGVMYLYMGIHIFSSFWNWGNKILDYTINAQFFCSKNLLVMAIKCASGLPQFFLWWFFPSHRSSPNRWILFPCQIISWLLPLAVGLVRKTWRLLQIWPERL